MMRAILAALIAVASTGAISVDSTMGSIRFDPYMGPIRMQLLGVVCGDGVTHATEACDDGNIAAGDGCSATCTVESYWTCTGSPSICTEVAYFAASLGTSGLSNLARSITVGATTVAASVFCVGDDMTAADANCEIGGSMPVAGSGTAPAPDQLAPFSDGTQSTYFAGAKYFQTASASIGQITTGDYVVEAVYRSSGTNIAGTMTSSGWVVTTSAMTLDTGPDTLGVFAPACSGVWCMLLCAGNRDENSTNGAFCFTNAVAGSGVNISSLSASLAGATFDIGSRGDGASTLNIGNTALVAVYEAPAIFSSGATGAAEMAALAKQRFQQLSGIYPEIADTYPATFTRAGIATMEQYDAATSATTLHTVGSGWPRVESWGDSGGTRRTGYRGEPAATNKLLQSNALGTTWALIDAGDTLTSDCAADVTGSLTADCIKPDATDGDHGVSQTLLHTAANHTFSMDLDPEAFTWAYLANSTVANATAYYDVANCTVGTVGAGASAYATGKQGPTGALCRIELTYLGTAANHTLLAQCAEANGDKAISGDGATTACAMSYGQVELRTTTIRASSRILTTTTTVTRPEDVLYYTVPAFAGGTVSARYLPKRGINAIANLGLLSVNSGSQTNSVFIYHTAPENLRSDMYATSSSVTIYGTTLFNDNSEHAVRAYYSTTNNRLFVDGSEEGEPDLDGVLPIGATRLDVGQGPANSTQNSGLISDVELFYQLTQTTGY